MKKIITLFIIFINCNLYSPQSRIIIFYGTSLTQTGKWVDNLMALFKNELRGVIYYNAAKGGMNSIWGLKNLQERVINKNPDIVTLEFAVNDCLDNPNPYYMNTTVPEYLSKQNAIDMIDSLQKYNPRIKILVLGMNMPLDSLVFGRNPSQMRIDWQSYYNIWRNVAIEKKVGFVDITSKWAKLNKQTIWKYIPDGLHPNELGGLKVTVPTLFPVIENTLLDILDRHADMAFIHHSDVILEQNYPNPFNPSTVINYLVLKNSKVKLKVYDVLGNLVAILVDEEKTVGKYSVEFNSQKIKNKPLASGIYLYSLEVGKAFIMKKMILTK